jgi:hypothetical protein
VTIIVTDSSPQGPVKHEPSDRGERGRGLLIVGELSVHWGWNLEDGGKAVYAILAKGWPTTATSALPSQARHGHAAMSG